MLALSAAATACSASAPAAPRTSAQPAPATNPALPGEAAIARTRTDSVMRRPTTADVHFMTAMIGHHAQALEMSRLAPTHGASATVRRLADRITGSQLDEIATMQRWLADRRLPVPDAGGGHTMMHMNGSDHDILMPGMLTDVQMRQLDSARGRDFDERFLALMIQHHRGAVAMVRELFSSQGAAQDQAVFKFASDADADQTTEIARMQQMLAALRLGSDAP